MGVSPCSPLLAGSLLTLASNCPVRAAQPKVLSWLRIILFDRDVSVCSRSMCPVALPTGDKYAGLTSLNAHTPMVQSGDMVVLLLLVALLEAKMGAKMFQKGHTPGAYGWDPLDMGKDDKEAALKEIKNGRLAMLAFSGIVTQAALTGKGFPYF